MNGSLSRTGGKVGFEKDRERVLNILSNLGYQLVITFRQYLTYTLEIKKIKDSDTYTCFGTCSSKEQNILFISQNKVCMIKRTSVYSFTYLLLYW